jgi:hypothetical protein
MVYLIWAVKLLRRNEFFVTTMKTSIKELYVGDKTVKSVMGIEINLKIFN